MPIEIAERRKQQQKLKQSKLSSYIDKAREYYLNDDDQVCDELVEIGMNMRYEYKLPYSFTDLIRDLVRMEQSKATIYEVLKVLGYKIEK